MERLHGYKTVQRSGRAGGGGRGGGSFPLPWFGVRLLTKFITIWSLIAEYSVEWGIIVQGHYCGNGGRILAFQIEKNGFDNEIATHLRQG